MATVALPELDDLARRLAGDRFDDYSSRALGRSFEEYVVRRRRTVGPVTISAGERTFPSFFALLGDPEVDLKDGSIRLDGAVRDTELWEFLTPFERIVFRSDGSADLHPPGGSAPHRSIARVLLREHFLPRTRAEEDRAASGGLRIQLPSLIGTLEQGLAICRTQSLVPFSVAILLYTPEERIRYEFDLVHMTLLADPRAGRLAAGRRAPRTSRISWGVDRTVGRGDLSMLATRCLEVLVESNGISSVELTHVFGGVRELVDSAVQGLVQRRLVTFDRRTGVYRARLEAFEPEPTRREEAPPASDPALRTSVQELIAAADARATCPLCGRRLPPAPGSILCAECAAMVSAG